MIRNSNNGYKLICDNCGYEVDGMNDFSEAVDYKKENGWKSKNIDGQWEDNCPNCREERY